MRGCKKKYNLENIIMSVNKNFLIKSAFVVGATCASFGVFAGEATVWKDSAGDVVKDGAGNCLHTVWWKKGSDNCGAAPKPVAAAPTPVVAPAPVKAAPVKNEVVHKPFSLSSGAAFKLGGSTLSAAGKAEIRDFANKVKGYSISSINVDGYTDSTGPASFNQKLSEKRAHSVKHELVTNGIAKNLITATGHGESSPVASNATRAGRAQNRRVSVTVKGHK
jgi:OOP family OmpA-OmpF porin